MLFVYKRPASTRQLLNLIVQSGTCKLYIFADGPKNDSDREITHQVRQIIKDYVSQHTEIRFELHFSRRNQGLKKSIVAGLNHVFAHEQAAIILEDDCIPSSSFFRFMQEMLLRYKNVTKIMSVSGSGVGQFSQYSYDFSRYQFCWGWATWARAWGQYDGQLSKLNSPRWQLIAHELWSHSFIMYWYWKIMLFLTKQNQINSWAFRWSYSIMYHNALAIIPSNNLIKNVGFDKVATNTITRSPLANQQDLELNFPLTHPASIIENQALSSSIESHFYRNPIAILGMLRQLFYYLVKKYAPWT